MNKTIKQAERYEAPKIKTIKYELTGFIAQSSLTGSSIESFDGESTFEEITQ